MDRQLVLPAFDEALGIPAFPRRNPYDRTQQRALWRAHEEANYRAHFGVPADEAVYVSQLLGEQNNGGIVVGLLLAVELYKPAEARAYRWYMAEQWQFPDALISQVEALGLRRREISREKRALLDASPNDWPRVQALRTESAALREQAQQLVADEWSRRRDADCPKLDSRALTHP